MQTYALVRDGTTPPLHREPPRSYQVRAFPPATPYVVRQYYYDADGLLRLRAVWAGGDQPTPELRFRWDSARSVPALLSIGSDTIVSGIGPLYAIRADGSLVILARDGIGSVRAELTTAGSATRSFRYASYGALAQSSGGAPTLLAFAGQYLDVSGLYYMRARWYDPITARFTTRDPLNGDSGVPFSLNGYAYAGGNPILASDPSGMAASTGVDDAGHCTLACVSIGTLVSAAIAPLADQVLWGDKADARVVSGITVVSDAGGQMGAAVTAIGGCCQTQTTVTFSSTLIVSTGKVEPGGAILAHEPVHAVDQAQELGWSYLPAYGAAIPGTIWEHGFDWHDIHPAERQANEQAGLLPNGVPPPGWHYPWLGGK